MKQTLNTNILGEKSASLAVTTEKLFSLYVVPKSGSHRNHRVTLEFSPDNETTWVASRESVNGNADMLTLEAAATHVRACVCEPEGEASTVDIHIIGA